MSDLPRRITIMGLGLMGGSLAHALARLDSPPRLTAVDADDRTRSDALAADVVQQACATLNDAPPSDLLVLATPVSAIVETLRSGGGALARHDIITDVGSVKLAPQQAAAASGMADRYAGSHPLCGDHRGGFAAARADLYGDCTVYVTHDSAALSTLAVVTALWEAVDAVVVPVDAVGHDALVARTSHLPQIAASLVAATLADTHVLLDQLGPGGRDTTRVAASDARLWTDILLHNRAALDDPLALLEANLQFLRRALAAADAGAVHALLARASGWRSNER